MIFYEITALEERKLTNLNWNNKNIDTIPIENLEYIKLLICEIY
jgi:hypothetical protein